MRDSEPVPSDGQNELPEGKSFLDFVVEQIRPHPQLNLGAASAYALRLASVGWAYCVETLGYEDNKWDAFVHWLDYVKYGAPGSAHALTHKIDELGDEAALEWFFGCLDEYLQLERNDLTSAPPDKDAD